MGVEEAVQTRQTRRARVKPSKAVEWESTSRAAHAPWDTDEDNIQEETFAPAAPRPNCTRNRSQPIYHATSTTTDGSQENYHSNTLAAILTAIAKRLPLAMASCTQRSMNSRRVMRSSKRAMSCSERKWKNSRHTKKLTEELVEIKAQFAEARTQWAEMAATVKTLSQVGLSLGGFAASNNGFSSQTYASVLTNSIDPSSSASQPTSRTTSSATRPGSVLPGVTVDTRRMKDKSKAGPESIPHTEKRINEVIQAVDAIKEVQIAGIQVKEHHVRVLTSSEEDAALLRTNDRWIDDVFEGARTRGDDGDPIKIDDVVKAAVVKADGHTIKEDIAHTFCAENGVTGVLKRSGSRKATKQQFDGGLSRQCRRGTQDD